MSARPAPTVSTARAATAPVAAMRALRALACAGALAWFPAASACAATADSTATVITLRNGLRVLLAPDPAATAVDVACWIEAGVRYERPGALGVSHLLQVMTSAGPAGGSSDRRRIEAEGGSSASYTAADYTCYSQTVPPSALETALRLEAARLAFEPTAGTLEAARGVARAENRAHRANPVERGVEGLDAFAFADHPYRWPVLGGDRDLDRLTLEDCRDFLRARYTPAHTLITVSGAFDRAEAQALARRLFESIPGKPGKRAPVAEPAATAGRHAMESADVPVNEVAIGWVLPATADAPAFDLLAAMLTQGPLARMTRYVPADDARCPLIQAGREGRRDANVFWIVAVPAPEADSAAVERRLLGAVDSVALGTVHPEEVEAFRHRVEVATLLGRETARDRAQALGIADMVAGDWREADRSFLRLRSLTASDVQQAARALTAARRTMVWLRPGPGGEP